ncbi:hypothetical protein BV210_01510 [Halorientalis sp. IM1011]|uniref:glycosyltransferase family 39 protein n=1 Tax=Halorientalis sp. IM1011 TaxID=1932360 RepID=UPI00097CD45E|nr:glycosyltransferase family 39 protein [Halorientalis sp. IM1011]AQL41469.1 hypothetical protein BV210_01510 [Halorientalis sp. IM1011]
MSTVTNTVVRIKRQIRRDLRHDPYLAPILLGAFALAAFWFWHRVPNFATYDERDRLLDPLVTYSAVLDDPSLESLREGVTWSRAPFGATFYLYAVAILPVVVLAVLVGDGGAIADIYPTGWEYGHWQVWHETPAWIWSGVIAAGRFANVCLAVGSVYVTYRLGVAMRDRPTGRLAAFLLAVTFGLLMLAHEAGEDVPALFTLLCSLYLLVRYVQTGSRKLFFASCALGGFAVAFKLTAGLIVPVIGLGYLLRVRRTERAGSADGQRSTPLGSGLGFLARIRADDTVVPAAYWRPKLLVGGMAIGALGIALGFPSLLVGDFASVWQRWFGQAANRASVVVGPTAPSWWWFLRAYFAAFGLPLTVALLVGVPAGIASLRSSGDRDAGTVVAAALVIFLLVLTTWHDFRPHHLLPTFPLAILLLAAGLVTLYERRPGLARPLVAALLLSTTAFAATGVAGYAATPRAEATDWLDEHAPANATVETYHQAFDETALPHDMNISHHWGATEPDDVVPCPQYIQLSYQDLLYLRDIPVDQRERDVDEGVEARAEYIRALLDGEYAYEIEAEFGQRPPNFVPQRPEPGSLVDIIPMGITPRNDFYGDEQEMGPTQYVVILERTGECGYRPVPDWEGGV